MSTIMDWMCSGCNRHYPLTVTECPHCQPATIVSSSGTNTTVTTGGASGGGDVCSNCICPTCKGSGTTYYHHRFGEECSDCRGSGRKG